MSKSYVCPLGKARHPGPYYSKCCAKYPDGRIGDCSDPVAMSRQYLDGLNAKLRAFTDRLNKIECPFLYCQKGTGWGQGANQGKCCAKGVCKDPDHVYWPKGRPKGPGDNRYAGCPPLKTTKPPSTPKPTRRPTTTKPPRPTTTKPPPPATCPPFQRRSGSGACVCDEPTYLWDGKTCVCNNRDPGYTWVPNPAFPGGGKCMCATGYEWNGSKCVFAQRVRLCQNEPEQWQGTWSCDPHIGAAAGDEVPQVTWPPKAAWVPAGLTLEVWLQSNFTDSMMRVVGPAPIQTKFWIKAGKDTSSDFFPQSYKVRQSVPGEKGVDYLGNEMPEFVPPP